MRAISVVLTLLIAFPVRGWGVEPGARPDVSTADIAASSWAVTVPVTVTAPRVKDQAALETARAAGAGAAVAGTGLMAYVVVAGVTGPFGWAAALVFLGGMTAYLSHRRLQGKEDFSWSSPPDDAKDSAPAKP